MSGTYGGDNGSAMLTTVSSASHPVASAVNDGARRGLRMLKVVGRNDDITDKIVVRVAIFATKLWRTLNGDTCVGSTESGVDGVCAGDAHLRCALLSLWQWIWPKSCFALLRVQGWKSAENSPRYKEIGAHHVMKISEEERQSAIAEETALGPFNDLVRSEIDRQLWRGEMAMKAYEYHSVDKRGNQIKEDGIGEPLPPIQRDEAFKSGGWLAATARQRRAMALDGGQAMTVKFSVKRSGE